VHEEIKTEEIDIISREGGAVEEKIIETIKESDKTESGAKWNVTWREKPAEAEAREKEAEAVEEAEPVTAEILMPSQIKVEEPAAGTMFWFLVTGVGISGEGSAGSGTMGPRILNTSGTCAPSCRPAGAACS
jgi:hypothetical protein